MNLNKQLLSINPDKKMYFVTKIFKSAKIQYKNLIIKNNKDNKSIRLVDLDYVIDKNDQLLCTTLITDKDYVIIGFNDDDRVHIVYVDQIIKLPTSNLFGHHSEYGCNYDEKLLLANLNYDTFQTIIESFDDPKILMTKKNKKILREADMNGLINPILYYKNEVLENHFQQKKMEYMDLFSLFINSKSDTYFCHTTNEYLYYKDFFRNDPTIMPIQIILYVNINNDKFLVSTSIFNGIPLLYTSVIIRNSLQSRRRKFPQSSVKKNNILLSDLSVNINQRRHDILFHNVCKIKDANFLNIQKPAGGKMPTKMYLHDNDKEILATCVENMKPLLDETYDNPFNTCKIYNKILEANCDPKLIYGSNEVDFCFGICSLYSDIKNNTYLNKNDITIIDKIKKMNIARQEKFLYDLSGHNIKISNLNANINDLINKSKTSNFFKKRSFVENIITKYKYPKYFSNDNTIGLNIRNLSESYSSSESCSSSMSDDEPLFKSECGDIDKESILKNKHFSKVRSFRIYFGFTKLQ